ncbi:MAG: cytochrome c [Acidobacteria bacterium]|nr:cytochrome c [Acidobacteriota bacterium]
MQKKCQTCHRPGSVAPMALLTYDQVKPWAKSIREQVAERKMPPFHAAGPLGHFLDDPRLTDEEIATVKAWVASGSPKGDLADMPPPRTWPSDWELGQPSLILSLPKPYTPRKDLRDDYQNFVLDRVFTEDTWIRGVEIRPGNRKAIHHANVFLIRAELQGGPDGRIEGGFKESQLLLGWVPGIIHWLEPEGRAYRIPKGTKLGMQIHYAPTDDEVTDQTSVGLYFANGLIQKRVSYLWGGARQRIEIPPGEANYRLVEKRTFPEDAVVRYFYGHMHLRGKSWAFRLHYPDGRVETLGEIPKYDFNWQRVYRLAQSVSVPKGTVAEYIATWDNSANNPYNPDPTQLVRNGQKTVDEMMGGYIFYEVAGESLDLWVDSKTGRAVPASANGSLNR